MKWRGNFGVDWSGGAWNAGWNAQYYNGYRVCKSYLSPFVCAQQEAWQGATRVPSQLNHDAYLRYDFGARDGVLSDTDISIGVHNLFNEKGPTIASGIAFSNGPVAYGDPRLRRFTLAVHKHF